jgi:putative oxidoreductase
MSYRFARWVPLLLRLVTGYGLMAHGVAKLSRGAGAFAAVLEAMHVPAPAVMAWLVIVTELLGGFAVAVGGFIPVVAFPIAAVLVVAMATVHWPFGFSSIKLVAFTPSGPVFGPPGYELNLFYLACLTALVLGGPGPLALDTLIATLRRSEPPTAAGAQPSAR